jgi:hypothetical protein
MAMIAANSSIYESEYHRQVLLNEVVKVFTELLIASGATISMIKLAMEHSVESSEENSVSTEFTDLGSLLRDCMEVMCAWRRDVELVDSDGEPKALQLIAASQSFETLCSKANCRHPSAEILKVLLEFGAVSKDSEGFIHSETPTFLLGRPSYGGRIATDGLLKQLEGFLGCVHRNVHSVAAGSKPKFERACTVTVALELEPIFDRLVRRRGQEFIDSIDEWLERNVKVDSPAGRYIELGAGAYYVDHGERQGRKRVP